MHLIDKNFGKVFCQQNVKIDFAVIEGLETCRIKVKKSKKVKSIDYKDKNGQKSEKLYIRKGNETVALEKPSEIAEYISKRL